MITRKLSLVFGLFFVLSGTKTLIAQQSAYAIVLNEYNVSNVPNTGQTDEKGAFSDYVEIYNNFGTQVSLAGYYLSNDRNNLMKWKFPSNFIMGVATYSIVWLSGKNTNDGINFHTNFTIDQCKKQYLILSSPKGVVYDSVLILPTKPGHVRGRNTDYLTGGVGAWKIYPTKSPWAYNGNPIGLAYAPMPRIFVSTATNFTQSPNTGNFSSEEGQVAFIRLNNFSYDTASSCFDIFYTTNGDYPVAFYPGVTSGKYFRYMDSATSFITLPKTAVVRAIAVARPGSPCANDYLPSFCETNTYFMGELDNAYDPNFGVLSLALESTIRADTGWFNSQGVPTTSVHVEYYDGRQQVSEGYAMITRPPQEEWRTKQKGFYITKDDRLGFGCNFEGNIFNVEGLGTSPRKVFPTLHAKGGDYESHSTPDFGAGVSLSFATAMRDIVIQSIAAKNNLNVSPLHIKPIITFVNGEYWGVYDLREVYDKYYEQYYYGQSPDSLDLNFVHNCTEGSVSYWDGSSSSMNTSFDAQVYNVVKTKAMNGIEYNNVMAKMDKASFIDFMALNSYAMNSDLWCNNVALAKGANTGKPGGKWHFYLWNMPSVFNYTVIAPTGQYFNNAAVSPCYLHTGVNDYQTTVRRFNGHGNIMRKLMNLNNGNKQFQLEYKNRYQDLLNGPLKCDNIVKHVDYIYNLYTKEMLMHQSSRGKFMTTNNPWDTNMVGHRGLKEIIQNRCYFMESAFTCLGGGTTRFPITVDVKPEGAGKVKLNTMILDSYKWYGNYFPTTMSLKAIPTSTDYVFHHWEITGPISKDALSLDSIGFNFNIAGEVVAVFTDKRNGIVPTGPEANIPTAFTPNGDDLNEVFRPLGSAEFTTEYQMTVWNRWGQEVFRSVDPLSGWDGRYKGQEAQTGVYAYIISYKNIYNETKLVKGNVTLTR
jgi:gliding motility-associated-like protein